MTLQNENFEQPICQKTKWREDFPVDRALDQYISRREYIKFLILISGTFAIGQILIGLFSQMPRQTISREYKITNISNIPIGGFKAFQYPDKHDTNYLVRLSESKFVAYSNKCTHLMCPIIPKVSEHKFHCPCHQGYFDIESGRPIAGPPNRPLAKVILAIKGDDIYAIGMEEKVSL